MQKRNYISLLLLPLFLFMSCTNSTSNSEVGKQSDVQNQNTTEKKDDCNCSDSDARSLASKIEREFTQTQNQLESQYARVMSIESIDKRDNCTWVVNFKISWPFGNTDGAHPDEYVTQRFACDGKSIYVQ
jgi:hypothetical protein